MNKLSDIAKQFLMAGINGKKINIPDKFKRFEEVFDVPEKPKNFKFEMEYKNNTILIPVSGGLDSTICYFLAKEKTSNIKCYYFNSGQRYKQKEIEALNKLKIPFKVINLIDYYKYAKKEFLKEWKHIIPARNFLFLSTIAELSKGGIIYFGALNGEIKEKLGGDKSRRFIEMMNEELNLLPYPVNLELPLKNYTKATEIKMFLDKGYDIDILKNTVSCFDSSVKQCGKCQSCLRRYIAFKYNNIELDDFEVDVIENTKQYQEKYLDLMRKAIKNNDYSQYSKQRCEITLSVLENL